MRYVPAKWDKPLKRALPWIRFRGERGSAEREFYCTRCLASATFSLDGAVAELARAERTFVTRHKRCAEG